MAKWAYQGLLACAIPLDDLHDIGISPERIPANLDWLWKSTIFHTSPPSRWCNRNNLQTFFDFEQSVFNFKNKSILHNNLHQMIRHSPPFHLLVDLHRRNVAILIALLCNYVNQNCPSESTEQRFHSNDGVPISMNARSFSFRTLAYVFSIILTLVPQFLAITVNGTPPSIDFEM